LIALLGVSLFILGCDDSSDDAPGLPPEEQLIKDLGGTDVAEIDTDDGTGKTVKLTAKVTLKKAVEVPAGVTLDTNGEDLDIVGYKLTVKGKIAGTGGAVTTTGAGSVSLENATPADNTANLVWALGESGTGKILKLTLAKSAAVAAAATVPKDLELTVAADTTLIVDAGVTLTVADDGAIILTGAATPAKLVLSNAVGDPAKATGGGKLALTSATNTDLGDGGAVKPTEALTTAQLTATGTNSLFVFVGTTAALGTSGSGGFGSIDNSTDTNGFASIEAATVLDAAKDTNGAVILQAGTSGTATINKGTTAKTSGAGE
jgi:hypothetical protein